MRAFFDPSEPVGVCHCGEVIHPSEAVCPECQAQGADPLDLDPVMIAVLVVLTVGSGILIPLIYSSLKIVWR